MNLGTIVIFWGLPITAGCGSLIAVNHYGLTRCLQAIGAAFWAAGFAYDEAKSAFKAHYRTTMKGAI